MTKSAAKRQAVVIIAISDDFNEVLAKSGKHYFYVVLSETVEIAPITEAMMKAIKTRPGIQAAAISKRFASWLDMANFVRAKRTGR